jgi:signal transduction histidine kinase/pSer/pThr/pTyr-binding forkhead associated (FHA) protein
MSESSRASLTVVLSRGLQAGARFALGDRRFYIGRGLENDVRLDETMVAEQHALIERRSGRFVVENVTKGARTTINHQFVRRSGDLYPGDMIEIAGTIFRFELDDPDVPEEEYTATVLNKRKPTATAAGPTVLATSRFELADLSASATEGDLRTDFHRVKTAFNAVCTLLNTFDLETLCERMLDAVFQLVKAEHGSVQLRRDDGTLWTAHARSSLGDEQTSTTISTTVLDHVLEHREAVLAMDVSADERFSDAASIQASRIASLMAVPLLAGNQVLGILYVVNTSTIGAFREGDLDLMSAIGVGAGLVLSNNHLYRQLEDALARQVAFNDTLKKTVDERTLELREKNHELSRTLTRLEETQEKIIAQEKLASLGALTSGVAHEMLNPMNFVNNFATLLVGLVDELREKLDTRPTGESWPDVRQLLGDIAEASKSIHKHGSKVEKIVQGMRQLSQTKGGEHAPAKLNELLSNLVGALRNGESTGGPRITTLFDSNVGEVDLVVGDLGSSLLNILHNAVHAARSRATPAPAGWVPQVIVTTKDLGPTVQVTVRDNGDGIPPDLRAKVFEPFFTTKPSGEGIGLGLSIAHDVIVKVHGGSIDIESEVGKFTEVRVTIPRQRQPRR